MSRADRKEVPGLIDSLQSGDKIWVDRSSHPLEPDLRTFHSKNGQFIYTKEPGDRERMWFRYAVLRREHTKRPKLYTDFTAGF
jgi:hypothetical protein